MRILNARQDDYGQTIASDSTSLVHAIATAEGGSGPAPNGGVGVSLSSASPSQLQSGRAVLSVVLKPYYALVQFVDQVGVS